MLMGTLFTYLLDGVFAMQIFHYYTTYAFEDHWLFNLLVGIATLVEITHLCLSTHLTYTCLALNFGNPAILNVSPYSTAGIYMANGVAGFCLHIFFAKRILALTQNVIGKLATAVIMVAAVVAASASTAVTIQFGLVNGQSVAVAAAAVRTSAIVYLTASVVCDVLIAITMVTSLLTARELTSFSSTKTFLDALIVNTIETGVITSVCAVAIQVTFLALPPYNVTHFALTAILGRLYSNVLLASLNGRERARMHLDAADGKFLTLSVRSWRAPENSQSWRLGPSEVRPSQGQRSSTSFPEV